MALPCSASADALGDIRKTGRMLWGGDQEGGGPYVFPIENNPSQVTGFEVDFANRIGEYLKVKAEFTQGQWDKMPDMLRTQKIHAIVNGYEFTRQRAEIMDATIPYYVYALQLMGRGDNPRIDSWASLRKGAGTARVKIGVLNGSVAEAYARTYCGERCDVVSYDGNTDTMREVETGKLDATIEDTPIASFYCKRQSNPSVPAPPFVMQWQDGRANTGSGSAARAESRGSRAVGGRIRSQRVEPG
jgi:polar amino acid transport system substrate-binding protein